VPPAADVDPGPHEHRGRVLTFWPYVDHDAEARVDGRELGRTLAAVHRSLRDCDEVLPWLGPIAELDHVVDTLAALEVVDRAEASRLHDGVAACRAQLPAPGAADRLLHGDAHGGNVLVTPDGPRWTDFEDCCRGPIAWDLARLIDRAGVDALAGYGPDASSDDELAPFVVARTVQSEVWRHVARARDDGRLDTALDQLGP
jgi:Ser/Thr protein kinase RdoA (MazF antagonist)